MVYDHTSIYLNGRAVSLHDIHASKAEAHTAAEAATVDFIRDWLAGVDHFKLQTSGSTGAPKIINVTRKQLEGSARRTRAALQLASHHTAWVCLDTRYIAGKMMLVRALETNLKLVVTEPQSNPFVALDQPVDFTALVPLQLQEILQHDDARARLNTLRTIIVGGAALPPHLTPVVRTLTPAIYATYGMTETLSHIALQRINGEHPDEHFTALPGIAIETDERHCLVIHIPEFNEPVVTNDVVTLTGVRSFRVVGRYDSVINSGGVKIIPEKVEAELGDALRLLGRTDNFCLAGLADTRLGERAVLLIEGAPDHTLLDRLREEAADRLTPYEFPKAIYFLPTLIYTPTGKVNRRQSAALIS